MRIQHNIAAMNSYRNYTGNANALNKNLEKLSSGYRINRAGDDAAGLAISEKMRAQIAGLDQAQSNVKDGISLVKTAEGALQEVQDMMNRMVTLATQSANGTYQDDVDRDNLQAEVDALKSEIDRIANSSNFNGQKLLDGSLASAGSVGKSVFADLSKLGVDITSGAGEITAVKGEYKTNAFGADTTLAVGDKLNITVNYTDGNGKAQSTSVSLYIKKAETGGKIYLDDGTDDGVELSITQDGTTAGKITDANVSKALAEALSKNDDFKSAFEVDGTTTAKSLVFKAREGGSAGAVVNSVAVSTYTKTSDTTAAVAVGLDVKTKPADATKAYDLSKAKVWNNDDKSSTNAQAEKDLNKAIFEVNGEKFVFVNKALTDSDKAQLKEAGVEHWVVLGTADGAALAADVTKMAEKISTETGLKVETGTYTAGTTSWSTTTATTHVVFKNNSTANSATGGLTLQIGDTAEDYNQLNVSIDDMHTKALGIADIDISNIKGAQDAIQTIKDAINKVSSTRGNLGAIQNRLEHTQNNLSVMTENIQDAESTIRDTDIADEMTTYTKNNILLQSAQAMLAQANQMPQGVLQLLQ